MCGKRFGRDDRRVPCVGVEEELKELFQVNIQEDSIEVQVHPGSICIRCSLAIHRFKQSVSAGRQYSCGTTPVTWSKHTESNCTVCLNYQKQRKGGRPLRKARKQPILLPQPEDSGTLEEETSFQLSCPSDSLVLSKDSHDIPSTGHSPAHNLQSQISEVAGESLAPYGETMPPIGSFIKPVPPLLLEFFQCVKCHNIVNRAVQLQCQHLICSQCLLDHLQSTAEPRCLSSSCSQAIGIDTISPISRIVSANIQSLRVRCNQPSCQTIVQLGDLQQHSQSHSNSVRPPAKKSKKTDPE